MSRVPLSISTMRMSVLGSGRPMLPGTIFPETDSMWPAAGFGQAVDVDDHGAGKLFEVANGIGGKRRRAGEKPVRTKNRARGIADRSTARRRLWAPRDERRTVLFQKIDDDAGLGAGHQNGPHPDQMHMFWIAVKPAGGKGKTASMLPSPSLMVGQARNCWTFEERFE